MNSKQYSRACPGLPVVLDPLENWPVVRFKDAVLEWATDEEEDLEPSFTLLTTREKLAQQTLGVPGCQWYHQKAIQGFAEGGKPEYRVLVALSALPTVLAVLGEPLAGPAPDKKKPGGEAPVRR